MEGRTYTIIPLELNSDFVVSGLTLLEAFTRIMALADRDYMFFRSGWVMHLVTTNRPADEPDFETPLATALYKRGLRSQMIQDVHPLGPMKQSMVGLAYTLRYIPAREDLNRISVFTDPKHPQRAAIEAWAGV